MENRTCTQCGSGFPANTEFFHQTKRGKYGLEARCKNCRNESGKKWRKNNPEKMKEGQRNWNREVKQKCVVYKGGKCSVCGYVRCLAALDFHHIESKEKEFTLGQKSRRWGKSLREELDKCLLLCSNCHRELHYANNRI